MILEFRTSFRDEYNLNTAHLILNSNKSIRLMHTVHVYKKVTNIFSFLFLTEVVEEEEEENTTESALHLEKTDLHSLRKVSIVQPCLDY